MKLLPALCAFTCTFAIATAAAEGGAGPTDAQIAAIVVTANQVDIDAGKLAKQTSQSKDVQAFAQLMITDHSGVNQAATDLVTKLHVTPESNPTSESLKQGGEQNLATLRKLQGAAFDRAYVDHEVAYHQAVLDAVDQTLIPNAKNAELKALLVKVRPAFVAHLEHAKQLQASLRKTVSMEGLQFSPASLTVQQGDRVTWVNRDLFPHTATADGHAFDSKNIAPNASWTLIAHKAGTFSYACAFHPTMKGILTVR
jgi:putative membrane protein